MTNVNYEKKANKILFDAMFHSKTLTNKDNIGFSKENSNIINDSVAMIIRNHYSSNESLNNLYNLILNKGMEDGVDITHIIAYIFSLPLVFNCLTTHEEMEKSCKKLIIKTLNKINGINTSSNDNKPKNSKEAKNNKTHDTKAVQTPAVAARNMEFNIENFVTHQDPPKQVSAEQLITKKPIIVEAPKPKKQIVGNPILDKSIEEKVKYLKTRIKFLDGVHKDVGVEELNALINLLDSPMFKQRIKELNCKSNISSVFLREVPMDKYGNSERITKMKGLNFNYCFEIPTKDKKDPIVVFLGSNDGWVKFNMTIYLSSKLKDSNK